MQEHWIHKDSMEVKVFQVKQHSTNFQGSLDVAAN